MPETLAKVQQLLREPDASLIELVAILDRDPALAAETLRLANSPYYGLKVKASSVRMACVVLGLRAVERLVLQATVRSRFGAGEGIDELTLEQLWAHSFRTALIARLLAICTPSTRGLPADDVYTCGLLHNVGAAAMLQQCPREFAQALRLSRDKGEPLRSAQARVLGFTDADVLAHLARRWNLGSEVAESAVQRRSSSWSVLVHAADKLAQDLAGGTRLWQLGSFADDALAVLGVEPSVIDWIGERLSEVTAEGG